MHILYITLKVDLKTAQDDLEKKEIELIELQKKQNRAGAFTRAVVGGGDRINNAEKDQLRKNEEDRARLLNNYDEIGDSAFRHFTDFEGNQVVM